MTWMVESLFQYNAFVFIFFKTMYNKTIITFGFCDIQNNQGLSKCYQPQPSASAITKTSSNNCCGASVASVAAVHNLNIKER